MTRQTKEVNELTMRSIKEQVAADENFYVSPDRIVTLDAQPIRKAGFPLGVPYRIDGGRLMLFTEGQLLTDINLETLKVSAGDLLVIPEQAIIQMEQVSDDINFRAFSFANLNTSHTFQHPHVLHLKPEETERYKTYIQLMWDCVRTDNSVNPEYDRLAEAAIEYTVRLWHNADNGNKAHDYDSRGERMFHQFVDLLNAQDGREHKPAFFADRLCVTVGHLSKVIKQKSGQTIMQWINRSIVMQAKIMLRHSDMPVYDISERLNFPNPSFFNRYFKRETGETPLAYRKGEMI